MSPCLCGFLGAESVLRPLQSARYVNGSTHYHHHHVTDSSVTFEKIELNGLASAFLNRKGISSDALPFKMLISDRHTHQHGVISSSIRQFGKRRCWESFRGCSLSRYDLFGNPTSLSFGATPDNLQASRSPSEYWLKQG